MSRVTSFVGSSVGKKALMAVSGFILFGFVFAHMVGNLKLYKGPDEINAYAIGLREIGAPLLGHGEALWIARIVLLVALVVHVVTVIQLSRSNSGARPVSYKLKKNSAATYAARTMIWTGPTLLAFAIYHILHLTVGWVHPSFVENNIYHNMVAGFSVWYISAFYIVAMIGLGYHMIHGVWSLFQSLGLNNTRTETFVRRFAAFVTTVVILGNISFPLTVLFGLVK